jgi:hypothetical protein
MNARAQGELAVGLLGVWAMIQAVATLANALVVMTSFRGDGPASGLMWALNVPSALMLGVGYLMVRHNAAVMTFLFPHVSRVAEGDALEPAIVLVGCLGLWIVASAVPSLVRTLLMFVPESQIGSAMTRASNQRTAAGYGVQAAFGLFMVFRPRRVLALWRS